MNYHKKLKNIKGFIIDIDGVLANNIVSIDENGKLTRRFYYRDLWAIQTALKKDYKIALINTTISSPLTELCNKIGFSEVYEARANRLKILNEFCKKFNFSYEEVAYIGDDIEDLEPIEAVGFSACPADAVSEIVDIVDYIATRNSGQGCIREILEKTLKVQGKWDVDVFLGIGK